MSLDERFLYTGGASKQTVMSSERQLDWLGQPVGEAIFYKVHNKH
jgi:hypothetical protein